jgi:hypothetical protein
MGLLQRADAARRKISGALAVAGSLTLFLSVTPAAADPCEGPLPSQAGVEFSGIVRYVVDGDGWCVGNSAEPNSWIEVRASDFDAQELRTEGGRQGKVIAAEQLLGRHMSCVSARGRNGRSVTSYDRVFAVCRIGDRRVSDILRAAGVPQGGN